MSNRDDDYCLAYTPDETRTHDCGCVHAPTRTSLCAEHWATFIEWLEDDTRP